MRGAGWVVIGAVSLTIAATSASPSFAASPSQLALAGFTDLPSGMTGAGTTVAVVDSGIDLDHPAFAGRIAPGRDFIDGDDRPDDENGHGTHVAGIVGAADAGAANGGAPGVTIMPVRVLDASGSGSSETVARGIVWAADHGAQVINLSIGDTGRFDRIRKDGAIAAAIRAVSDRAVVIVAAGNDSQFEQLFRAAVPAIVVVAVDDQGRPAPFTNVGDKRAVAAPGVEVLSTAPQQPSALFPAGTDGTAALSGTSMSAPFVSASAALLIEAGLSPSQVAETIVATAQPNADPRVGAGIVDAAAAVEKAASSTVSYSAAPTLPTEQTTQTSATAERSSPYLVVAAGIILLLAITFTAAIVVALRRP